MNLRQLEYFVSVAETLSFTKTSEQFFISQTAVTQQIKALEEQLDVVLLNRSKRKVELTPAGSVFLGEARAILSRMDNAVSKTKKAATGLTGSLQFGIIQGYDNPHMPNALRQFRAAYPNVALEIHEGSTDQLYSSLMNQTLDIAINAIFPFTQIDKHEFLYKDICSYPLIVLLPTTHPFAFRDSLNLAELKSEDFIFTETSTKDEHSGHFESTMAHFLHYGFTPNVIQTTENFSLTALMVASDMGIAIVPAYAVSSCRRLVNLVSIPLSETLDRIAIVAMYSARNTNPIIEKFLEFV